MITEEPKDKIRSGVASRKPWHAPKIATLNSIAENTLGGMGPNSDGGAGTTSAVS